jgi:uncharacterized protein
MTQLNVGFTLFLSLLLEAIPFLLLGIVISSLLLVLVSDRFVVGIFPTNPIWGAMVGSSLGLLLMGFQYGNVPVARRLLLLGIPAPVAMSFLVAAPTINPITIWLTWNGFSERLEIVFLRIFGAWLIASIIGCVFSGKLGKRSLPTINQKCPHSQRGILNRRFSLLRSGSFLVSATQPDLDRSFCRVGKLSYGYKPPVKLIPFFFHRFGQFFNNTVGELLEFGFVLIIGCAIAALCQIIFPPSPTDIATQAPAFKILSMLAWSKSLSIGATAKTGFAAGIFKQFTTGSLIAFLLFGSIIDLKAIGLLLATFRLRVTIYLLILTWELTFLFALMIDFLSG